MTPGKKRIALSIEALEKANEVSNDVIFCLVKDTNYRRWIVQEWPQRKKRKLQFKKRVYRYRNCFSSFLITMAFHVQQKESESLIQIWYTKKTYCTLHTKEDAKRSVSKTHRQKIQ